MSATRFKRVLALVAISSSLLIATPSAFAEDEGAPTATLTSVTPAPSGGGHESNESHERGERIDREFEASHPFEWIAVGLALALALGLAYTAGRRRRNRE